MVRDTTDCLEIHENDILEKDPVLHQIWTSPSDTDKTD